MRVGRVINPLGHQIREPDVALEDLVSLVRASPSVFRQEPKIESQQSLSFVWLRGAAHDSVNPLLSLDATRG